MKDVQSQALVYLTYKKRSIKAFETGYDKKPYIVPMCHRSRSHSKTPKLYFFNGKTMNYMIGCAFERCR